MEETDNSFPAGWYPDGSGAQRWWDGSRWTEHAVSGPMPAAQAAKEPPAEYVQTPAKEKLEKRLLTWNIITIVGWPILLFSAVIIYIVTGIMVGETPRLQDEFVGFVYNSILWLVTAMFVLMSVLNIITWADFFKNKRYRKSLIILNILNTAPPILFWLAIGSISGMF